MQQQKKMTRFLRQLADRVECSSLHPKQMQSIGEFYMLYQFQDQAVKDDVNDIEETVYSHTAEYFTRDEFIKFLILGWYIYSCLSHTSQTNNS